MNWLELHLVVHLDEVASGKIGMSQRTIRAKERLNRFGERNHLVKKSYVVAIVDYIACALLGHTLLNGNGY